MWMIIADIEKEYVINFDDITCFTKLNDCHGSPYIDLIIKDGAIQLFYDSNEERNRIYEKIIQALDLDDPRGLAYILRK